jgi:hypothetical protein
MRNCSRGKRPCVIQITAVIFRVFAYSYCGSPGSAWSVLARLTHLVRFRGRDGRAIRIHNKGSCNNGRSRKEFASALERHLANLGVLLHCCSGPHFCCRRCPSHTHTLARSVHGLGHQNSSLRVNGLFDAHKQNCAPVAINVF